ncbi:MAG: transglycosylase domain-containing protein [Candidatus Paceibacterota bacterium]|jgi:membrane carboxypeptidase/penicillin-binding protein PbpC
MKNNKKTCLIKFFLIILLFLSFFICEHINNDLKENYLKNSSQKLSDRNNEIIFIIPNDLGYYNDYLKKSPVAFEDILINKEDRFFYSHKGFNPVSILKAVGNKLGLTNRQGSSTLSQQLVKILLSQENQRNMSNKIIEVFYTIALELSNNKEDIMIMYLNTAYFGNRIQGVEAASHAYFNANANMLTTEQSLQLLAALNSPTNMNPVSLDNIPKAKLLAQNLKLTVNDSYFTDTKTAQSNLTKYLLSNKPLLEMSNYAKNLPNGITEKTTLDKNLNTQVREIVQRNMDILKTQKAKNASVVILSLPSNEIVSLLGSPDPASWNEGYQINMLENARQIGSTIKPFIYLNAFEKGMRPYTIIDDREYKYATDGGFALYPKNYDYQYHGEMTAHYALNNSINVPAVKTLEFVGLKNFEDFLTNNLELKTVQPIESYQFGIALGALEMTPFELAHYFTIFPNEGKLKNLKLFSNDFLNNQYFPYGDKQVAEKNYIELINKILSDRKTGIDQFSAMSSLNLPYPNYALKTGTSHDYTDSWIMGYTPDFLVGVWVGNADNSATDGVSGQIGAGRIWNEIMQLLMNSEYSQNTPFDFSDIKEFQGKNGIEFGLQNDNFEKAENIIKSQDDSLILSPHDNDTFLYEETSRIILKAKAIVTWTINNKDFGSAEELIFQPKKEGRYVITASASGNKETVSINFNLR